MSKQTVVSESQYSKVPTDETKKDPGKLETPATYGYGIRHVQLIIVFLCAVTSFVARGHLGVTLVAMTTHVNNKLDAEQPIHLNSENYTNFNDTKEFNEDIDGYELNETDTSYNVTNGFNSTEISRTIYSTFIWTKPIQEMVLTSFFMGYLLMMLPMSVVCQRWGGKVPLQVSLFVNGVVSLLTPTLAHWGGWQAVCVCRLLQGFSQSGTFPGIQTLLAHWVPDSERGTLAGYVYTGCTIGSVIGFQIGGFVSDAAGWPATFWTVGSLCLIVFTLLTVFGTASPRTHKTISEEERKFIMGQSEATVVKTTRAPWKALLKTKPLLANFATAVGSGVSFVFFFTQVPSYLHYIYGINVKNSGMLSSLPYIGSVFGSILIGVISDYLINHKILSRKNTRRFFNLAANVGTASALVGAAYASNTTVVVICFVIFMVSYMGIHPGWMLNQIDLAPNYSGTLIAISNCGTNSIVLIMPFVISNIIVDVENVFQWRIMLCLEAAIPLIPAVLFVFFMTDEVQPWNDGSLSETEAKDTKLESNEKPEVEKEETNKQFHNICQNRF